MTGRFTPPRFRPTERLIAAGGEDREVKLWNAETASALYAIPTDTSIVSNVRFLPDGKRVAAIVTGQAVIIDDIASKVRRPDPAWNSERDSRHDDLA